jgi:AcrR family transcriptional regulator
LKEEVLNKRAAALMATLQLIDEQGFQGAPMSEIAKRAGIGVGTIYRYFDNKNSLINALYLDTKSRVTNYVTRNYSKQMPVYNAFKVLIGNAIQYYLENPSELNFIEQYENSPLITTLTREEGARLAEPALELFSRARKQGLLKDLPLEMIGALFSGSVISLVKMYSSKKEKLDNISIEKAIDAIWDMIKR